MGPLDVAIVGTGTAGSATALFLARQGHRVTLYEKVPEPQTVGAGIMLQPSGLAVLRTLGLDAGVLARGDRIDAWVLSEAMRGTESVADALYRYSRLRRWHLGWYQFITRWLTPFFQSDHGWLQPLRDHGLAWATRVPWVRKQMVSAMCGVSRGPFMELLRLP